MGAGVNLSDRVTSLGLSHGVVEDWPAKDTNVWTTTSADSGTATVGDGAGGVCVLAPGAGAATDNNEVYIQTKELYKIAANKPLVAACRLQFAEANTDDANVFFGVLDAPIANTLVDNGAGMKTSFSGAAIFKVDGSNLWQCIYSDGSTQTLSGPLTAAVALNKVAQTAGGSAYQLLEIEMRPFSATRLEVIFKINGVCVFKMMERTYASATEMALAAGAKLGGANAELVNIDYIFALQKR